MANNETGSKQVMNIEKEIVAYKVAKPARKRQVVLWLLTGGRFGKLFVEGVQPMARYTPENYNCRCVSTRHGYSNNETGE